MGIQGLLPFLKKASRQANVREFKGCTVAIDSYCWLHRGAFSCAEKLAMGEKTDQKSKMADIKYVHYCMKYVNSLLAYGLRPIMVFDGCRLPSKRNVEKARRERREINRKKAAQFMREGKRSEARDCLTKCIDITPHMALELMNACRAKGVDCIVAPYEADAQSAYLSRIGVAQLIITEDSDLVLFGCDCIMFKMDFAGNGVVIEKRRLNEALNMRADLYTFDKFRYMCILSGCDYLPNLPGIGLGKACKIFQRTRQTDMKTVMRKIPALLNMKSLSVPSEYIEGFVRADNTFLYQLVYDPLARRLVPLTPYPPEVEAEKLEYAGPYLSQEKAFQIALGNIDINTGERIAHFNPGKHKIKSASRDGAKQSLSIWDPAYQPSAAATSRSDVTVAMETEANISRPCTKNTEVTVTLSKFQHTKKRFRQGDEVEEENSMDNTSLAAMYGESHLSVTPISQPEPKRIHAEDDCVEIIHSQSSYFHEPVNSPHVDTQVAPEMGEEKLARERRPLKLSLNKFAVNGRSGERTTGFSLNMSSGEEVREVKSRFFVLSPPHRKTTFFKQLETTNAPLNDGDAGDADSDRGGTSSCHPPDGSTSRRQSQICTRSPFSSFNFGKFSRSQNSPCGSTASTACFTLVKPTRLPCPAENDTFSETDTFSEPDQVSILEASECETLNGAFNGDSDLLASQRTSLYSIDTDDVEFSLLESDVSSQQSVDSPSMLSASFSRTDSQPRSLSDKSRKCQSVSSFFAREKQGQFSYAPERLPSMDDPCTVGSSQGSGYSDWSADNGSGSAFAAATIATTPLAKSGLKALGKCRASGLSRSGAGLSRSGTGGRKQKENLTKSSSSAQLTMRNFLGQFKLDKRENCSQ